MPAWLFGTTIGLLVGAVATAYLWFIRRRDDETSAGLLALAGMRWRDFSKLVLDAMQMRGLHRIAATKDDALEQSSQFLLSRGNERLLLACKHGSAYRIGSATVDEMAAELRMLGAGGGILVTEGMLDKSGLEKAERHNIEVLDGHRLWPEVRPMVETHLKNRIVGNAAARARRHIGIAWLGAFTLGAASAMAFPAVVNAPAPAQENPPAMAEAVSPTSASATAAAPASEPADSTKEPTETELDQQRDAVSRALANTAGISRGVWITRSTLSVDRIVPESQAWPLVCREVELYANLRTIRVQMNPPPGSDEPVRWRQCKTL